MTEAATCRSCHEPIRWVRMAESRKAVPIELGHGLFERGALLIVDEQWAYTVGQLARAIARREQVSEARGRELAVTRYPAHLTHFARCPHAGHHRRKT